MYEKEIGQKLKEFRRKKNLTQEKVAEIVNISTNHISAIERGACAPSLDTLIAIMNAIECTADDIFACVLKSGYKNRSSRIADALDNVQPAERTKILDVLEVMVKNSVKK